MTPCNGDDAVHSLSTAASEEACVALCRISGSNFVPCFRLLPSEKRRAMHVLYALMFYTDALADADAPLEQRRTMLKQWRAAFNESPDTAACAVAEDAWNRLLESLRRGEAPAEKDNCAGAMILPAVHAMIERYAIPREHFDAVFEGVEYDLDDPSFETFAELETYCHRVATAVGLASLRIWGIEGDEPEYLEQAQACGLAFQLTNILRDLLEDARRDRVYIATEDLLACGYESADAFREAMLASRDDAVLRRMLELYARRIRNYYANALGLYDRLSPEGRRIYGMMWSVYASIFRKIDANPSAVLNRRVRLPRYKKLSIAARWMCLPARRPVF